jgi:hypothetical protein
MIIIKSRRFPVMRGVAAGAGLALGAYGVLAASAWHRYGHPSSSRPAERDDLLDCLMPEYDVVERHHIQVAAPAAVTLQAAKDQDLNDSLVVRAIFKAREVVLRASPDEHEHPRGLLAQMRSFGWGVLADVPDREIVMGAVTKPWETNVTFTALPPAEFATFSQPGFVKIAWTLRADPVGDRASIFRTETRAVATDPVARAAFRRYWALASPGIALIRRMSLQPVRRDAERRPVDAAERQEVSE